MSPNKDRYHPGQHKAPGRYERSRGKTTEATDTMTTGAAIAEARAEPDEKTGRNQQPVASPRNGWESTRQHEGHQKSANNHAQKKECSPQPIAAGALEGSPHHDPADPSDSAVKEQHKGDADAYQQSPD